MERALQDFLDAFPETKFRSKLEPHRELIRQLRRKGRTYRDISKLLAEWIGMTVAPSTLHSFVKVRAKHRKRTQFELPAPEASAVDSPFLDRVAALKWKSPAADAKRVRFVFRENEPLTLTDNGGGQ